MPQGINEDRPPDVGEQGNGVRRCLYTRFETSSNGQVFTTEHDCDLVGRQRCPQLWLGHLAGGHDTRYGNDLYNNWHCSNYTSNNDIDTSNNKYLDNQFHYDYDYDFHHDNDSGGVDYDHGNDHHCSVHHDDYHSGDLAVMCPES